MEHYQVTLTTGNTAYELKTLVKAQNSSFKDGCDQFTIQSDDGNTDAVYLGGSAVTAASYGIKLPNANDNVNRGGSSPGKAILAGVYAVSPTNAQKVNISIFR